MRDMKNVWVILGLLFPGGFLQYDYGYENNIEKYGSPSPPPYNLTKVTAPIAIWHSSNDLLVYKEVRTRQISILVSLMPKESRFRGLVLL